MRVRSGSGWFCLKSEHITSAAVVPTRLCADVQLDELEKRIRPSILDIVLTLHAAHKRGLFPGLVADVYAPVETFDHLTLEPREL